MLADIAVNDPETFKKLCETAMSGLKGKRTPPKKADAKKEAPMKEQPPAKKETPVEETTEVKTKDEKKEERRDEKTTAAEVKETAEELAKLTVAELKDLCKTRGISGYSSLKKAELIARLQRD